VCQAKSDYRMLWVQLLGVKWGCGPRPALARLNRFEGTTQVYCLRKDFLKLTRKTRSGPGKGVEVETVPGGLILPEQGKIEEIRVELSLGPICFSKIRPCRPLDIPGPHIDNYKLRIRIVDMIFWSHWWRIHFGWWSGFYPP
jgi:hypothetical protein